MVLDLLDVDGLWTSVEQRMELIQKGLMHSVMDMSLITENKWVAFIIIEGYVHVGIH